MKLILFSHIGTTGSSSETLSVTIGKCCIVLFCLADGKTVDATQEMLALGACNLISSFVGSMPISGALSRGAVNNASGVKTPFGGIYTGKTNQLSIF